MTERPRTEEAPARGNPRRALWLVPLVALLVSQAIPGAAQGGLDDAGRKTVWVALWMGGWWLTEALPLPATSLLPLGLFPVLGIASARQAAAPYGHELIFLFLGGFLLAQGMARWGLHRRFALRAIRLAGGRPDRLVAGFMAAAATLSMWISNTATAVMLMPTALGVLDSLEPDRDRRAPPSTLSACLLLGVAYACSIGGLATLIGTPPNALLSAYTSRHLSLDLAFDTWLQMAGPVPLVLLPATWWILTRLAFPIAAMPAPEGGRPEVIDRELRAMGPLRTPERRVLLVFAGVVAGWILRRPLASALEAQGIGSLHDSSVATLGALALFMLPAGEAPTDSRGEPSADPDPRLLDWSSSREVPWGILLLFGGGLSLAAALSAHGVPAALGAALASLRGLPSGPLVLALIVGVVLLTEFTSNTATTAALLPVLDGAARGLGLAPMALMVPAALSASCAFMMPVATPPNALALATGRVDVQQLFRAGTWLNLLSILVIFVHARFWLQPWIERL